MKEYIVRKEFLYEDGNTYSFTTKVKMEEEDDPNRMYGHQNKRKVEVVYIDIFKVVTKTLNLYFFKPKFKKHINMFKDVKVTSYSNSNDILPTSLSRDIKRKIEYKLSEYIKEIKEKNRFNNVFSIIDEKFGDEVGNVPPEYKRDKNINEILE